MKPIIKLLIITFLVLTCSLSFGQFNTLTPIVIKEKNTIQTKDSIIEKVVKKENRERVKKTTKRDLKNEIDSLKIMIKSLNKNEIHSNFSEIKDSIFSLNLNQLQKEKKQNHFALYNFIEEPEEEINSKIVMPLRDKITVTSPYGTRIHPVFGTKKMHNGVDLKANYENVYSVLDGIITAVGWDSKGGGNYIKIKHFDRFETSYLHLSEMYYTIGERVKAGFVIAKSGNTGNTTGPHLHFAVKEYGENINPIHFLNDLIKVNNLITMYHE